jgi:hypothetical protein
LLVSTLLVVLVAGNAITSVPLLTGTTETAVQVLTHGVFVTVMVTSRTFVHILASVGVEIVDKTVLATHTVAINTVGALRTCAGTAIWNAAFETISNISVFASADLGVAVACGVTVTVVAWINECTRFTVTAVAGFA